MGKPRLLSRRVGRSRGNNRFPVGEKLGCEVVLAAEFSLTDIAADQLEYELGFELGGESPTRARYKVTPGLDKL